MGSCNVLGSLAWPLDKNGIEKKNKIVLPIFYYRQSLLLLSRLKPVEGECKCADDGVSWELCWLCLRRSTPAAAAIRPKRAFLSGMFMLSSVSFLSARARALSLFGVLTSIVTTTIDGRRHEHILQVCRGHFAHQRHCSLD